MKPVLLALLLVAGSAMAQRQGDNRFPQPSGSGSGGGVTFDGGVGQLNVTKDATVGGTLQANLILAGGITNEGPTELQAATVVLDTFRANGAATLGAVDAGTLFTSGNATFSGTLRMRTVPVVESETLTPFAGGGQANATQITKGLVFANPASSNDSIKLPVAVAGMVVTVCSLNAGIGVNLAVFPQSGSSINGAANTSAPVSPSGGTTCRDYFANSSTTWFAQ